MLCPSCGKDVGEKPRLCDSCSGMIVEEVSPPPLEQQSDGQEASSQESEKEEHLPAQLRPGKKVEKPTRPEEGLPPANDVPAGLPKVLLGLLLGIVGLCAAFVYFISQDSAPVAPVTSNLTPTPQPTADSASNQQNSATSIATPSLTGLTNNPSLPPPTTPAGSEGKVVPKNISLKSSDWKTQIALWKRSKSELVLAFFGEELTEEAKKTIAKTGVLPEIKPQLVLTLAIEGEPAAFSSNVVKSLKAKFLGKDPESAPFSSTYSIAKRELPIASNLSGTLRTGEQIRGKTKQNPETRSLVNGTSILFSWDFDFQAPVVEINETIDSNPSPGGVVPLTTPVPNSDMATPSTVATPATGAVVPAENTDPETKPESTTEDKTPEVSGTLGTIRSNDSSLGIKDALALYYPEAASVSIGFYGQELNDADRAEIAKKRILTAMVNGKRPSLILSIDFSKKNSEATRSGILEYTAYFYRDIGGLFYFSGPYDKSSVRRLGSELLPTEFTELSGPLKDGGTFNLRTKGESRSEKKAEKNATLKFSWNLNLSIKLVAVR